MKLAHGQILMTSLEVHSNECVGYLRIVDLERLLVG